MEVNSSLQLKAYNYIKELILSNKLDVDTLYSETKLAKEIGVSRTPMRGALQYLSQDGYITIYPSKGFMIRQLNQKDMRETIQIRCAIEGFCTYTIANEINSEKGKKTLKNLELVLENQINAINNNDNYESFIEYDHEFHKILVHYIENDEINSIFQKSMYLIKLTSQSALEVEGRINGTINEHKKYFEFLKNGDGDNAYKTLISHLMMPLNVVKTNK